MNRTRLAAALVGILACGVLATVGTSPVAIATPPVQHAGIAGVVTDSAGHPLAGVRVAAISWISFVGAPGVTTNGAGQFSIRTGPGEFYLDVIAGRATGGDSDATGYYAPVSGRVIRVGVGAMRSGVHVRLRPAGAIVGHVSDVAGHPLSGVGQYLQPVTGYVTGDLYYDNANVSERPSRNGWYRITGVRPGSYQVCTDAAYQHVTGGSDDAAGYGGVCRPGGVAVGSGRTTRVGRTGLLPLGGGALTGRVTGYDHAALRNVEVDVYVARFSSVSAVTDGDGRYWVHGVPAGSHRVCFVTARASGPSSTGYSPACRTGVVVQRHRVRHLAAVLTNGAALAGVVDGANRSALSGAPVEVLHGRNFDNAPIVNTGDSGRYRVRNLAPGGHYDACALTDFSTAAGAADPTGGVPRCADQNGAQLTLSAGSTTQADLSLAAAGGVRGTITKPDGTPLAGVEVDLDGPAQYGNEGEFYAFTDSHGHYQAVDLPPAKYQVCFSDVYFLEKCYRTPSGGKQITVTGGSFVNDVNTTLPHTPRPSVGLVVSGPRGQRLAGVNAVLFTRCRRASFGCPRVSLLGSPATSHDSEITDVHGRAALSPYRPGSYTLCLFAYFGAAPGIADRTGYADKCLVKHVTIPTHGSGPTVHVRLPLAGAVSGIATDKHGKPLANVYVDVAGSAAAHVNTDEGPIELMSPLFDARTDSRGRFLIRSVTAGMRRVSGAGRVTIRAGRVTRNVHVTLSRTAAQRAAVPERRLGREARPRPANRLPAWHAVRPEGFPPSSYLDGAVRATGTGRPGSRPS